MNIYAKTLFIFSLLTTCNSLTSSESEQQNNQPSLNIHTARFDSKFNHVFIEGTVSGHGNPKIILHFFVEDFPKAISLKSKIFSLETIATCRLNETSGKKDFSTLIDLSILHKLEENPFVSPNLHLICTATVGDLVLKQRKKISHNTKNPYIQTSVITPEENDSEKKQAAQIGFSIKETELSLSAKKHRAFTSFFRNKKINIQFQVDLHNLFTSSKSPTSIIIDIRKKSDQKSILPKKISKKATHITNIWTLEVTSEHELFGYLDAELKKDNPQDLEIVFATEGAASSIIPFKITPHTTT